jgi:hypothetical protein
MPMLGGATIERTGYTTQATLQNLLTASADTVANFEFRRMACHP